MKPSGLDSNRFAQFPTSLARQSRTVRFGDIPVLLCHPDPEWRTPAPTVVWLHGRTANKELDPGRYLRWIRAGLAACAIDLPGHGERADATSQTSARTLDVISQALGEIDRVVEHLADPQWSDAFDLDRLAIGGMSLGGMVTLRRLCDEHPFKAAAVEGTTGNLTALYGGHSPEVEPPSEVRPFHDPAKLSALDPMQHLSAWRPIPLLALHTESDQLVPVSAMRSFVGALQSHYKARGASEELVRFVTWPETGAPQEHIGFGRFSNDAKNLQTEFFKTAFGAAPSS